jgi:invasion protein IalB
MKRFIQLAAAGAALVAGLSIAGGAEAPISAEPAAGATKSTRQVVGDWVVACAAADQGHKSCVMSQTLASEKLRKTVSVLMIGKDQTGKLKGSLRLPIGVSLAAGVVIGIDGQDPFTVPYSACHRIGCFAPFDLTEPRIGQMKKASKITAVAESVSKQALNLNFSTRGFPAAYQAYLKDTE